MINDLIRNSLSTAGMGIYDILSHSAAAFFHAKRGRYQRHELILRLLGGTGNIGVLRGVFGYRKMH